MNQPEQPSDSQPVVNMACSRPVCWAVWSGLVLVILAVAAAYYISGRDRAPSLPVIGMIPEFTLTNHLGRPVTRGDLLGSVWVADIIFTRCAGPCASMTKRMRELQALLPAGQPVRLISLTTDPDFDTPKILRAYAERHGASPEHWQFLTGTKAQLFHLAVDGLKLTAIETSPGELKDPADMFIHSTVFVLVDRRGRLRGAYENAENAPLDKLLRDMNHLLREK